MPIPGRAFFIPLPRLAFAAPLAWVLEEFAYRTPLSATTFVLSGLLVTLFAVASVSLIVYRASKENPVLALRNE